MSNNPPEVVVGLSRAQADLLIETCDANVRLGLVALQNASRSSAEKLVALMEGYKGLKAAVEQGMEQ